jgi:hypothetical protein
MRRASHLRVLALLAGVGLVALAGCSKYKQGTPKELLESAHKATTNNDFKGMVSLMIPEYQEAIKPYLDATIKVQEKHTELAHLIEKKIDKDRGQEMLKHGSPLEEAVKDGKIDWSKVDIKESGDKATVKVNGTDIGTALVKVNGKWYVDMPKAAIEEAKKEDAKKAADEADKRVKAYQELIDGINKGDIKKDNYDLKFAEIMAKYAKP